MKGISRHRLLHSFVSIAPQHLRVNNCTLIAPGDVVASLGNAVGFVHAGVGAELPSSESAAELFESSNANAAVPGFRLVAPHVLVHVGEAVYAFWRFQGPQAPPQGY